MGEKRVSRKGWGKAVLWCRRALLVLLLVLTLLVTGLFALVRFPALWQGGVARYFDDTLKASVTMEQFVFDWNWNTPVIGVSGLVLQGSYADSPGVSVKELRAVVDLWQSVRHLEPVFESLAVEGAQLAIESDSENVWSVQGIQFIRNTGQPVTLHRLADWLNLQKNIEINNFEFVLLAHGQPPLLINTEQLHLASTDASRQLVIRSVTDQGQLELRGEGVLDSQGDESWAGQLMVSSVDLVDLCLLSGFCSNQHYSVLMNYRGEWDYRDGRWSLGGELDVPARPNVESKDAVELSMQAGVELVSDSASESELWHLGLSELRLQAGDRKVVVDADVRVFSGDERHYQLEVGEIGVSEASRLLLDSRLLSSEWASVLETLNPRGGVSNLSVQFYPDRNEREQVIVRAGLENVTVDAWRKVPSFANISGRLNTGLQGGYLDLESRDFQLGIHSVFSDSWLFDTTSTRLQWRLARRGQAIRLTTNNITATAREGRLKGQLDLDIPLDGKPLWMSLNVALRDGNADYLDQFIPVKLPLLSPELIDWLQTSIGEAQVEEGRFVYQGSLSAESSEEIQWGLYFDINEGRLRYHPDWPEVTDLKARVWVDQKNLYFYVDSAHSMGAQVSSAEAAMPLGGGQTLHIESGIEGSRDVLYRFLTETPVDEYMEGAAREWQVEGDVTGRLRLAVPMDTPEETAVNLELKTDNGLFAIRDTDLLVDQIRGTFSYGTESGLSASQVSGRFLEGAVMGDLSSDLSGESASVAVNWEGAMGAKPLMAFLDLEDDWAIIGQSAYRGDLLLQTSPLRVKVTASSDLRGITMGYPPPLDKSALSKMPTTAVVDLTEERGHVSVDLGEWGLADVNLKSDYTMASATFRFGNIGTLPNVREDRIVVGGSLDFLDLNVWEAWLEETSGGDGSSNGLRPWPIDDTDVDGLAIKEIRYGDRVFNSAVVGATGDNRSPEVEVTVASDSLTGHLLVPMDEALPLRLDIDRIKLPELEEDNEGSGLDDLLPESLPDMDVTVGKLSVGEKRYGSYSFKLRPHPQGKRMADLAVRLNKMHLTGNVDWIWDGTNHKTHFKGKVRDGNIENIQKVLGMAPVVSAKQSSFDATLDWEGTPVDPRFEKMNGRVKVKLEQGRLHKVANTGTDFLRLFGILNLETLTRRLQLDFTDLYKKGMTFDRIEGDLRFEQGKVFLKKPLKIEGPSSTMRFTGLVDTVNDAVDLSLAVTLPFSSNLPVISVLLGTAPQIAGLIYLADKLVGEQVDQLVSLRYRISGSIDNPVVLVDETVSKSGKKSTADDLNRRR